jgi:hypothetical protein
VRAASRFVQILAVVQPGTVTISHGKNRCAQVRSSRRNTCKISFFHYRNQITNAHVQITSVNSS